ncbi:MAG: hypothetical protein ACODAG_04270 [Myxococcota bacterium]
MSEPLTQVGVVGLALLVLLQALHLFRPLILEAIRRRRHSVPPPPQGPREDTGQFALQQMQSKVETLHDAIGARPGRRSILEEKVDRHGQLLEALVETSRKQTDLMERFCKEQRRHGELLEEALDQAAGR